METSNKDVKVEASVTGNNEAEDALKLEKLDIELVKEVMQVPTVSGEEFRMVTFIVLWARRNNINYEFDTYGNLYLTKGEIDEGQFYPCVTSHLDTVQSKQKAYAEAGAPLDLNITKESNGKHKLSVEGMGIGADCKTGVLICLSLFSHFDALKAAFFLEEEVGMKGSAQLNEAWFDNVGYVVGWDSPDLNRAAWCCSGTKLFGKKFFEEHLEDICKLHGLTDFRSEPFTDVKNIREKTELICMNFGNGGYLAHSSTEYMIIEDTDHALCMGIDIIDELGRKQYKLKHVANSYAWIKREDGTYVKPKEDEDVTYFNNRSYSQYGDGYMYNNTYSQQRANFNYSGYNAGNSYTSNVVRYMAERYESHIRSIKEGLEDKCKELGIDFSCFEELFAEKITF